MKTFLNKTAHPNRKPFVGILTRLDVPSDKSPSGARGHRVMLTKLAAEQCLNTLIGMAVGFKPEYDGHDARRKCGVITEAFIVGDELRVLGHVYARDFPEVAAEMDNPVEPLGMSFEMIDATVEDMREQVWKLTRVTFTGAAILLCSKAAYSSTSVHLEAGSVEIVNGHLALTGIGIVRLLHAPETGHAFSLASNGFSGWGFVRWIRQRIKTARESRKPASY